MLCQVISHHIPFPRRNENGAVDNCVRLMCFLVEGDSGGVTLWMGIDTLLQGEHAC